MKTKHINRQAMVLLSLSFLFSCGIVLAQDGKTKGVHTEKRMVTKHGKDSTVTILKEDISNGTRTRKTIVINNGDTSSNIVVESTKSDGDNHSAIIIDGDSIVKITKNPSDRNMGIDHKAIIIINGDSVLARDDNDQDVNITIDTSAFHEKYINNKAFKDAAKKGITMNNKYIIINTQKLAHSKNADEKRKNVVGKIGVEGFDLGFTQFVDNGNVGVSAANNQMDLNVGKSVNVNFRVFDLKINLVQYRLYLNAGLEFDLHDYRFSGNTTIVPNSDQFQAIKDTVNLSKSKLATQYLELPVMLCFNTNPDHLNRSVNIGAGVYGGMLLGSYTKQISDARGKQHFYGNFDCNTLDYGVIGQLGYGNVQLFGKYNMSSLFQTAKGAPDLQSITFGIKLFHPMEWN